MIIAAEVKRDEQGYWTHPALVRSGWGRFRLRAK